jgi:hypothetical protein
VISNTFLCSDDDKPKETTAVVPPSTTSSASKGCSQEETMVVKPSQDLPEKTVGTQPLKHQKRATRAATASLEAHQPSSSSDHVSNTLFVLNCCLLHLCFLIRFFSAAIDLEISISWR